MSNKVAEKKLFTCSNCGHERGHNYLHVIDGIDYCDNCVGYCERCEDSCLLDNLTIVNHNCICQSCLDDYYFRCHDCEEYTEDDNSYEGMDGYYYCEDCYYEHFTDCQRCGETISRENGVDINEDLYCHHCERIVRIEEEGDEDDGSIIKDYSYQPKYVLHKQPWENTLYLGVELEVNTPTGKSEEIGEQFLAFLKENGWKDYLYLKSDCSIGHGFEIVSHPFTLQARHAKINWYKIMAWLKSKGCSSYKKGCCGLHVHVSRKDLSINELGKMKLFMSANTHALKKFSKRKDFNYCKFHSYSIANYKHDVKCGRISQAERAEALNCLSTKQTVEFRLFRGTLDHTRFLASLQMAEAITLYCKEASAGAISSNTDKRWKEFVKWLRISGRYSHLVKYIVNKRIK